MTTEEIVAIDNRPVCQPIAFCIRKLLGRGFTILNNGDYKEDCQRPNDESLYFRLQSPSTLDALDLNDDTYYLAQWGTNSYMCECHYHMVKLVSVV